MYREDRWWATCQIKRDAIIENGSSLYLHMVFEIHPLRCLWAAQRLNLSILHKTLRGSTCSPSPRPLSLMTWVSCFSGPPTLWTAIILAASPFLATLFIYTQITASSFQLSILLPRSERNAYRCQSCGELQARSWHSRGRANASIPLLFLGAALCSRGLWRHALVQLGESGSTNAPRLLTVTTGLA